jgi:hypothetical protein
MYNFKSFLKITCKITYLHYRHFKKSFKIPWNAVI